MRALRLADVARHARVSEATVSRVLNDKPGVAATTRQAVLEAIDLMGYDRPSKLRRRSAGLVGLVVPELTNPVFPLFAQVIETALSRHGFTPVLCTQTPGGIHEDEYVQMLLDRGVAGIVFVSGLHANLGADHGRYHRLRAANLPIVLVNGPLDGLDAPFVSNDDAAAVGLAVDHLAGLGHTRIGLVVGPDHFTPARRRVAGFRQAMVERFGADADLDAVAHGYYTVDGGTSAADHVLDRGCTGLVCGSDLMALGAVRAARSRGLRVPDDVSVVGCDDSFLLEFTDPPLTSVRQQVPAMAEAAVRALLDEIAGDPAARAEYVFRPELVVRGSTAPVA